MLLFLQRKSCIACRLNNMTSKIALFWPKNPLLLIKNGPILPRFCRCRLKSQGCCRNPDDITVNPERTQLAMQSPQAIHPLAINELAGGGDVPPRVCAA